MRTAALMALRHVLAAIHAAVAVPVGAAAALHVVTFMLAWLLTMLSVLAGLMLLMVLVLGGRCLCDGGGGSEDERYRG